MLYGGLEGRRYTGTICNAGGNDATYASPLYIDGGLEGRRYTGTICNAGGNDATYASPLYIDGGLEGRRYMRGNCGLYGERNSTHGGQCSPLRKSLPVLRVTFPTGGRLLAGRHNARHYGLPAF